MLKLILQITASSALTLLVEVQVREPRAVLKEFGTELSSGVAVHVHDSTADLRYKKQKTDAVSCDRASATVKCRSTAAAHSDARVHSEHEALPRQAPFTEFAVGKMPVRVPAALNLGV